MRGERASTEECIHSLQEADVMIAQSQTGPEACEVSGLPDKTYFG